MTLEELKYPIGKFKKPAAYTLGLVDNWIETIEAFPVKLKKEVENLSNDQLDTPYRPYGWTIRQVVNHCADSHMNSFTRFKLALTEDKPTIKPYFEERWAELADSKLIPIAAALLMLEGLHQRWVVLLRSLTGDDLKKSFIHPEHGREIYLDETIANYAWHCEHHLAHIIKLKEAKDWN